MKKSLILGLTVAVTGSLLAFGGAFALYKKDAEKVTVNIGAKTSADLDYTITDSKWNTGTYSDFQPGVTNTLNFKIGATNKTGSTYTQDVVVGKLSVEITCEDADFINYFDGKINATVAYDQITVESQQKDVYWAKENRNKLTLAKADGKLSGSIEVPVALSGNNVSMPITLPADIDAATIAAFGGASYSVNVKWDESSNFKFASVRGSMNGWAITDEWQMVPMINTEEFEWKYIPAATQKAKLVKDVAFKCYKYVSETDKDNWSTGDNYVVTEEHAGKISGIYWKGKDNPLTVSYDA